MTRKPYQDSDEWREERRGGYGASDAPILVEGDEAAWRQLHGEKLGMLPGREANETMQWARSSRTSSRGRYAERTERRTRVNRLVRHPDLPYVFASLDGRVRGNRPVEVKKWGFKTDALGRPVRTSCRRRSCIKLQQQAAVTGADAVEVADPVRRRQAGAVHRRPRRVASSAKSSPSRRRRGSSSSAARCRRIRGKRRSASS